MNWQTFASCSNSSGAGISCGTCRSATGRPSRKLTNLFKPESSDGHKWVRVLPFLILMLVVGVSEADVLSPGRKSSSLTLTARVIPDDGDEVFDAEDMAALLPLPNPRVGFLLLIVETDFCNTDVLFGRPTLSSTRNQFRQGTTN